MVGRVGGVGVFVGGGGGGGGGVVSLCFWWGAVLFWGGGEGVFVWQPIFSLCGLGLFESVYSKNPFGVSDFQASVSLGGMCNFKWCLLFV